MTVAHDFTVGVGGQARSGKDTLGRYLVRRLNEVGDLGGWERRGLADPVKRIFMDVSDVNEAFVESWKTRPSHRPAFSCPFASA